MMPPGSAIGAAAALDLGPEERLTSQLRPGVAFPDWSAVSSASAHAALSAMLEATWGRRAWRDWTSAEDAARRRILELYRDLGRAPSAKEMVRRWGMAPRRMRTLVERLAARDLIVLEDDQITGAYPLTDRPSEHRVGLGEWTVHAMCAIDALGVGAIYATNTAVESRCRLCRALIDIRIRDDGRRLERVLPAEAVVFASISYRDRCAATSLCTTIAFFCSGAHLDRWRSATELEGTGLRLSIDEAFQVGRAIFGPVLLPPSTEVRSEATS